MRVIIMIGAAGSGKTHYIDNVLRAEVSAVDVRAYSANDFFYELGGGTYRFDREQLQEAHAQCMYDFIAGIHNATPGDQVFVIDNTNVNVEQIAPYVLVARAHGADVEFVVMTEQRVTTCYDRNRHGVAIHTISQQIGRIQRLLQHWPGYWATPTFWPEAIE